MNSVYAVGPHDELVAALSTHARTVMCEVEVVRRLLLARDVRHTWTRAGLERAIGGNPLDLSDALSNLADVGVIALSEEPVMLSRTAHDVQPGSGGFESGRAMWGDPVPALTSSCAGTNFLAVRDRGELRKGW
jgi:hypothetical protein